MASYNELIALIDAYINRNGVQAITGQVLNGVLKAMVEQIGRGYAIMGTALPADNPGTPDAPESWFASTPGTYTNFGGLEVADAEFALLSYTPASQVWEKTTLTQGITGTSASVDSQVGTPSVSTSYEDGVLSFEFHNLKGETGDAAGFGSVSASVDGNIGTPGVSVSTSGPDTAKNMVFAFRNLKGETGVTSVVATVDNTIGNPSCAVSLQGQELHLDFHGLKGAQGDTGSSIDYPFTIVNNLTTNDPAQALSAAMGVQLEGELGQLEAEVNQLGQKVSGHQKVYDFERGGMSGGSDVQGDNYIRTPNDKKIPITATTTFTFSLKAPAGAVRDYAHYKYLNGTYIGASGPTQSIEDGGSKTIEYDGTFNELRFRIGSNSTPTGANIADSFATDGPIPVIVSNEQRIEKIENNLSVFVLKNFNKDEYILGSIQGNDGGDSINLSMTRYRSPYIKVAGLDSITAKISGYNVYTYLYDKNKAFLASSGAWLTSDTRIDTNGAFYFRYVVAGLDRDTTVDLTNIQSSVSVVSEVVATNVFNLLQVNKPGDAREYIAHRGLNVSAPQNTMSAFRLAVSEGFKSIEMDVRFTSDGVPVILHNATIDATSNGTGRINQMTLETALTYDFGSWFSPNFTGEKIPTLYEVLQFCRENGVTPWIEMKDEYTVEEIAKVLNMVCSLGLKDKAVFLSSTKPNLTLLGNADDEVQMCFACDTMQSTDIAFASGLKNKIRKVWIMGNAISDAMVSECLSNGVICVLWYGLGGVEHQATIFGLNSGIVAVLTNNFVC